MSPATAVSRSPNFLDHNCLLVSVQKDGQDGGDEEHDSVYDTKSPGSFQHPAIFANVPCPSGTSLFTIITKRTKTDVYAGRAKIRTIGIVNAPKLVDSSNECADEAKIDKGNKEG